MKKVAFISLNDHVPWGGSEVLWSELAMKFLAREGFEVAISPAKWEPTPGVISKLLSLGARDYRRVVKWLPMFIHRNLVRTFPRALRNLLPFGIYEALTSFKPDLAIISLGDHNLGEDWARVCRQCGIPYVLIVQLVKDASYPPSNSIYYQRLLDSYTGAVLVLLPSYDNQFLLEKQFARKLDNAVVVNNPIRKVEKIPVYPENQVAQLAMVASLNPSHKGQDILFEVLSRRKWRERELQVNLYGSGAFESALQNLVKHWQLENVKFRGFAEIEQIWSENQILILPTRMEGLSLAFLEALNCERTAIVTNLGDANRFVDDNLSGFLISAAQADLLDEAMERAWQARDQWRVMGQRARAKLWQEIVEDPIEHSQRLLLNCLG
jgi:glycosyltransferase involved in cell wall biosynthesis